MAVGVAEGTGAGACAVVVREARDDGAAEGAVAEGVAAGEEVDREDVDCDEAAEVDAGREAGGEEAVGEDAVGDAVPVVAAGVVVRGAGRPSTPHCTTLSRDPVRAAVDPAACVVRAEARAEEALDSRATGSEELLTAPDTTGTPTSAPATRSRGSTRRGPRARRSRRPERERAAGMREDGGPAGMWCTESTLTSC
ncbi:hypothetical protein [Geodermatophilus sp. TF02-6]|uniref:hypothetical protein n=1 Tax=Geodermatophilus sp. TF02-6 TaxID=2250575 RepID=UPI0011BD6C7A|nr:hypothetical protein [Geodermatophilus sp. TF02-6]